MLFYQCFDDFDDFRVPAMDFGNVFSLSGAGKSFFNAFQNSLKRFLKESGVIKHHPSLGKGTISGLMVTGNKETGLAEKVEPIILGECLESRI